MRERTCCLTGHRKMTPEQQRIVAERLYQTMEILISKDWKYFGAGGALGFDLMAADVVLQLKKKFPHIKLIMVLPCRDQTRGWKEEDIRHYERVLAQADKVVYIQERYSPGCMQKRNRHLVDYSSVCVAYCTRDTGGTAYTVRYARQKGLEIINLADALCLQLT